MNVPSPQAAASHAASMTTPVPLLTRLSHWAREYSELVELQDLCDTLRVSSTSTAGTDDSRPRVWNVPI